MLYDVSFNGGVLVYKQIESPKTSEESIKLALETLKKLDHHDYMDETNFNKAKELSSKLLSFCEEINSNDNEKIKKVADKVLNQKNETFSDLKKEAAQLSQAIMQKKLLTYESLLAKARNESVIKTENFVKNVQNYGLKDEDVIDIFDNLFFISSPFRSLDADIALLILKNINHLGIKDQKSLIQIFEICIRNLRRYDVDESFNVNFTDFISNINREEIEEGRVVELATIMAKNLPDFIAKNIKIFQINDISSRLKLAKIVVAETSLEKNYKNFELEKTDINERISLAQMEANKISYSNISPYIKDYGIDDEKSLLKIANSAVYNDSNFAEYIESYGIKDPTTRYEYAKLIAERQPDKVQFISNFHLKEQEKIEIAQKLANYPPFVSSISELIQFFNIKDENVRLAIAHQEAERTPLNFLKHIENYNLSHDKISEFEKKITEKKGFEIFPAIFPAIGGKFYNKDMDKLRDLMLLAAQKEGINLSENFHLNGFTNEAGWLEMAQYLVSLPTFLEKIDEYPINPIVRGKIAEVAVKINLQGLMDNLSKFELDEKYSAKIAFILLKLAPPFINDVIKLFKIKNEDTLMEMMSYAVRQTGDPDIVDLGYLGLSNKIKYEFFLEVFSFTPGFEKYYESLEASDADIFQTFVDIIKEGKKEDLKKASPKEFHPIIDKILKLDKKNYDEAVRWLAYTVSKLSLIDNKGEHPDLWSAIYEYRDPKMRYELTKSALSVLKNSAQEKSYSEFSKLAPLRIPALFLSDDPAYLALQPILQKARDYLKDGSVMKPFIDTLALLKKQDLNKDEIIEIIKNAFTEEKNNERTQYDKQKVKNNLFNIQTCISADQIELLVSEKRLDLLFPKLLKILIPDVKEIPHFLVKFSEKFKGNALSGLVTYASRLNSLPPQDRSKALKFLTQYVDSVLDDTFENNRYDEKLSPHLEAVFKKIPDLKDKWRLKPKPEEEKKLPGGFTAANTDDYADLLLCGSVPGSCQRVDGDPDKNKALLSYLLDGKTRLFQIKDDKGVMVARTIVRILLDEKDEPVLFQEGIYAQHKLDPTLITALNDFVKEEARRLGLAHFESSLNFKAKLQSKGTISPWEYVDSAGGIKDEGIYEILGNRWREK